MYMYMMHGRRDHHQSCSTSGASRVPAIDLASQQLRDREVVAI